MNNLSHPSYFQTVLYFHHSMSSLTSNEDRSVCSSDHRDFVKVPEMYSLTGDPLLLLAEPVLCVS